MGNTINNLPDPSNIKNATGSTTGSSASETVAAKLKKGQMPSSVELTEAFSEFKATLTSVMQTSTPESSPTESTEKQDVISDSAYELSELTSANCPQNMAKPELIPAAKADIIGRSSSSSRTPVALHKSNDDNGAAGVYGNAFAELLKTNGGHAHESKGVGSVDSAGSKDDVIIGGKVPDPVSPAENPWLDQTMLAALFISMLAVMALEMESQLESGLHSADLMVLSVATAIQSGQAGVAAAQSNLTGAISQASTNFASAGADVAQAAYTAGADQWAEQQYAAETETLKNNPNFTLEGYTNAQKDVTDQQKTVTDLNQAIQDAEAPGTDVGNLKTASQNAQQAVEAQKIEVDKAQQQADSAKELLDKAESNAQLEKDRLEAMIADNEAAAQNNQPAPYQGSEVILQQQEVTNAQNEVNTLKAQYDAKAQNLLDSQAELTQKTNIAKSSESTYTQEKDKLIQAKQTELKAANDELAKRQVALKKVTPGFEQAKALQSSGVQATDGTQPSAKQIAQDNDLKQVETKQQAEYDRRQTDTVKAKGVEKLAEQRITIIKAYTDAFNQCMSGLGAMAPAAAAVRAAEWQILKNAAEAALSIIQGMIQTTASSEQAFFKNIESQAQWLQQISQLDSQIGTSR